MAEEIIDGKLKVTTTPATTIEIFARDELVGKRAEEQTKVDHLQLDLDAAKAVVAKIDKQIADIDKG